jgi:hypothetical protein
MSEIGGAMPRRTPRTTTRTSADVDDFAALALGVQVASAEPEVRRMLEHLPAALERTIRSARLQRAFRIGPGRPEAMVGSLRDELWQRFGPGTTTPFFLSSCDRLVGRDVALPRRRGGGASAPRREKSIMDLEAASIDLLGLADHHRQPVAVQVVRGDSLDGILSALVRVIGALALLRHAWTLGFHEEWARTLLAAGYGEPALPPALGRMTGYVLVRSSHWSVIEEGARDPDSEISTLGLQRVHTFVDAAARQRMSVSFAEWRDDGPYADTPMAWFARLPGVGLGGR